MPSYSSIHISRYVLYAPNSSIYFHRYDICPQTPLFTFICMSYMPFNSHLQIYLICPPTPLFTFLVMSYMPSNSSIHISRYVLYARQLLYSHIQMFYMPSNSSIFTITPIYLCQTPTHSKIVANSSLPSPAHSAESTLTHQSSHIS